MIPASIIHMQRGKRNSRNHQTHGSRKYGRSRTQKYIAQRGGPRPAAGSVARFEKRDAPCLVSTCPRSIVTIKALVRRDTRIFFRFKSQLLRCQFISRRKLPIPPLPHPSSPPPSVDYIGPIRCRIILFYTRFEIFDVGTDVCAQFFTRGRSHADFERWLERWLEIAERGFSPFCVRRPRQCGNYHGIRNNRKIQSRKWRS